MQFEYTEPQSELEILMGGFVSINIFGLIEVGDDEKFLTFLENVAPPPRTTIYINSVGGDVEAAMGIGRLIRAGWHSTSIGTYILSSSSCENYILPRELKSGKCMSAATLVYLSGRLRYFPKGSNFGVHQFSFKNPSPNDLGKSQILSASIAKYIEEMGIPAEFLEQSALTPGDGITLLIEERLKELRVVTGGITEVDWTVQSNEHMLYVRGERDSLFGHHKVMLGHSKGRGFMFWAVVEAQGREMELTEFGLVEVVVNEEDIRIDISDRCERSVYGIYVNILAAISEEEAQCIAYSTSFGVQVRASDKAEIFLGVAAMSTKGGEDKLKGLYNNFCR